MGYIVGLTGGIASGKTTATDFLRTRGIEVIDADEISRALTGPGGPALSRIAELFGAHMIRDGRLDRAAMRELVFSDPNARRELEAILHPLIAERIRTALQVSRSPYTILSSPLLVEKSTWLRLVDTLCVIDCPESVQIARLMQTRGLSREMAQSIIAAQASRLERVKQADTVIDNSSDTTHLHASLESAHLRWLAQADAHSRSC